MDGKTMRGARTTDGAPHLAAAFQLRRTRTIKGRITIEVVYAICSLDMIAAPPATVATRIQDHWGIENSLHWDGPRRRSATSC